MGRPPKNDDVAKIVRKAQQLGDVIDRKQLVRKLSRLRKASDSPVRIEVLPPGSPAREFTEAVQKKSMRFLETLQHNAGRDLSHLKHVVPRRRYAHMRKSWKGAAGRAAAKEGGWNEKQHREREARKARVLELSRQGRTPAEIRRITQFGERTIRGYLNGR